MFRVCETLAISQEEAEEVGFVPSALGEPRGALIGATIDAVKKAFRYWQTASMVVEQGGEAHTINLCRQCLNEQFGQQGRPRLKLWQGRGVVEKKAHQKRSWKVVNVGGKRF